MGNCLIDSIVMIATGLPKDQMELADFEGDERSPFPLNRVFVDDQTFSDPAL